MVTQLRQLLGMSMDRISNPFVKTIYQSEITSLLVCLDNQLIGYPIIQVQYTRYPNPKKKN